MRGRSRIGLMLVVLVGLVGLVAGRAGAVVPSPASAYGADARHDNGPGFDPRGDVVSFWVSDNGTEVRFSVTTTAWDDPGTSPNWNRAFTGPVWYVDTNGDGVPDYDVDLFNTGGAVFKHNTGTLVCEAGAGADQGLSFYRVIVKTSCLNNPVSLRVSMDFGYDTGLVKSYDLTGTIGPIAPTPNVGRPAGYWMAGATGLVYSFGTVPDRGSYPGIPAVKIEATPTARGYWELDRNGAVYTLGDAAYRGNATGIGLGEYATTMSRTATGNGYWIFTNKGHAIPRGDAVFYGDMSHVRLNQPVINSVSTSTGHGYYMVAADGGVFTFGDAHYYGSTGGRRLNQPVVALVPTATGHGYWLVAADGGIFTFGDAPYRGSMGATRLNRPIVGMVRFGNGYLMVAADGGIFNFSNQPFYGSLGSTPPNIPIVSVASST